MVSGVQDEVEMDQKEWQRTSFHTSLFMGLTVFSAVGLMCDIAASYQLGNAMMP